MTRERPSALRGATHVAFDTPTAERLVKLGVANVVRAADRLVIGPSCRDATAHVRAREAWRGRSDEEWDRLYSADVRWEPPVAVWVSTSPADHLNLWRACCWLRDRGVSHTDVLVVDWETAAVKPGGCWDSVAARADDVLRARLAEVRPVARERFDRAAGLWAQYVDADLSRFARSCARGLRGVPQLGSVWSLLSSFLPRVTAKGALRLSRFDGLLFEVLSGAEWLTPVKLYVDKSTAGDAARAILGCTGDLFLARRLADWAGHIASQAIDAAPGPAPGEPLRSHVYRLTECGTRLRKSGLAQLADAPVLPVAGVEAYAPASPWAVRTDGALVRL